MPSPKSAKQVGTENPEGAEEVLAATDADPGKVAEVPTAEPGEESAGGGGTGDSSEESEGENEDEEDHWISFALKYDDGTPVGDEPYKVKVGDGTIKQGRTDAEGKVKIEGLPEGNVEVTFPRIPKDVWKKA